MAFPLHYIQINPNWVVTDEATQTKHCFLLAFIEKEIGSIFLVTQKLL